MTRIMFVGHFAVGLAAKRAAPGVSLGVLFLGCQLLDLIWPVLVLAGVERVRVAPGATAFTPLDFEHYPWSHSLVMSVVWSLVAFAAVYLARRSPREAAVVAAVVVSHWVLDFFTHRPDLPLLTDGPKVGLGLWNSVAATFVVEIAIFAAGIWLFVRTTRPRNKTGRWAFAGLIAFLLLVYVANAFGPQPPVGTPPAAIAGPALAMWLLVAWAFWADRNRTVRPALQRGN